MRPALLLFAAALAFSSQAFALERVTPKEADAQINAGETVLIDIRTPDEWADTGVAPKANPIDMTSDNFVADLKDVIAANPGKKLAFICRSGRRSGQLTRQLEAAGLTNIVDVQGGMSEWIGEGLPVRKP